MAEWTHGKVANMGLYRWLRVRFAHHGAMATGHGWTTRWVHWVAAALLLFAVITNGDVTDALVRPSAMQFETYVGIALAVVYGGLWLWLRGPGKGSRLPAASPSWERRLAGLVHNGIYLSIVLILLSGFAMAYLAGTDITLNAAGTRVAHLTARFANIRDFHEFSVGLMGWLFGAHFAGALWHLLVRRDGVMQAMALWRGRVKGLS
jgi:cytochrome b561